MILVDSSVWIEHFRSSDPMLRETLEQALAVVHPFVIGELALGHVRRPAEVLSLLRALPRAPQVSNEEVMAFVEVHHLAGTGIGWIDAHLLAAARLTGCRLWTLDRSLAEVAARVGVA